MTKGYIKLWRTFKDFQYLKDPEAVSLWIYFLLEANWEYEVKYCKKLGRKLVLQPGQLTMGRRELGKELGIDQHKIDRLVAKFQSCDMIEPATKPLTEPPLSENSKNRYRCITIKNWDKYQQKIEEVEPPIEPRVEIKMSTPKEEERTNTSSVDWKAFIKMWNSIAPEEPGCRINKITDKRKEKINRRIAEMGSKAKLMKLIERMWKLNYFYGANTHEWYGSLDWLIKNDENWVKLDEGKYDFAGEIQ